MYKKTSHKTCQHCSLVYKIAPVRRVKGVKNHYDSISEMQLVRPPILPKNGLSIYHGIKKDFKISGGRVELLLQFSPCSLLDEGKVRGMCFCPWLSLLSLEKPKELGCHTSNLGTCACGVVWRVGGWVGWRLT